MPNFSPGDIVYYYNPDECTVVELGPFPYSDHYTVAKVLFSSDGRGPEDFGKQFTVAFVDQYYQLVPAPLLPILRASSGVSLADIETMNTMLNAAATQAELCERYEETLADINSATGGRLGLVGRVRNYRTTIEIDMSFSAATETEAESFAAKVKDLIYHLDGIHSRTIERLDDVYDSAPRKSWQIFDAHYDVELDDS